MLPYFFTFIAIITLYLIADKIPRMVIIKKFISSLLLAILSINSYTANALPSSQSVAQSTLSNNFLKFNQLSTSDGLSNSNVFNITQDHQGFIWFATEDGLNRFDGNNIVVYRHNTKDKHSIADNIIRKIFIDSEKTLWVGTENGLSRYNYELDNFNNFVHEEQNNLSLKDNVIWDIYQNKRSSAQGGQSESLLWIATTQGLQTLSVKTPVKEIAFDPIYIRNYNELFKEIKTIFQDNAGTYWLGSYDKGIHLLSKNLNYIGSLNKQNKHNLSITATALFDMKTIDNQYWLATDNGLYIVDDRYQLISHLTTTKQDVNDQQVLLSNNVRAIAQYDESHIWLATHNGLNTINLLNRQIQSYQSSPKSTSISDNWLMDIYRDNNNNMWLASYGGGVNQYSALKDFIYHGLARDNGQGYRVESFAESSDGTIWLSTEKNGLFSLSKTKVLAKSKLNLNENIWQVFSANDDELFLRTESGKLYQYDINKNSVTEHKAWFNESNHPVENFVVKIKDSLWYLNSKNFLAEYHIAQKTFTVYPTLNKSQFINFQVNGDKLFLLSTKNQAFIFDTNEYSYQKTSKKLTDIINNSLINNIWMQNNNVLLGTESQGLTVFNEKKTYTFNENNGLQNNYIASLLVDSNDNIWVATNTSINAISLATEKVIKFDVDFDINTPEFQESAAFKSSNGDMFFGSPNGFYQFNPDELLKIEQNITAPIFTNLYVANKKVPIKVDEAELTNTHAPFTLKKQLNALSLLELAYKQSPISFEFVSPNAKLNNQIRYKYRLVELETEWIDASLNTGRYNNRATYTNLSPGNYIFEVQAFDVHSPQKTKISRLHVRILPPWWLSASMIAVYAFISFLFLTYIFQQYKNKKHYNSQIKESEERLKLSLWGSGDEMWDWNIITDKIYRSNIWGVLDFPQDGTRNKSAQKHHNGSKATNIHQHDIERVKKTLADHVSEKTEHFEATYRVKDKYNQWIWILDRGKIVERDEKNNPSRMTGTLKDISKLKKTEESLKLFAKCIQNISDAVVIYDRQFTIVDINKAFQRITGQEREDMIGQPITFKQYPQSFTQKLKQHLVTKGSWHGEVESLRADGSKFFADLNLDIINDENDQISHFVGVFSDITKRKQIESELRKLASSDILTGLPNRSYFQAHQARLVKSNINHALFVFDLDNFKKINDSMGHQIGDAILCQVAKRMLTLGREQDTVYRLGGDEFSIILEGTNDIHTITSLAKDILRTVAIPFKINNQEIVLYSSIGVVLFPEDGNTGHELLKNADTAMYHAKGSGGNKYQFFSASMNKQAVKRLQIESLIRHGLKDDSFSVYYQPKIEIASGKISGMEALVRFETPSKGIISPVVFIPVSEETGQIIDIGEIVLRKACFATKKWVDAGLFTGRVAVNLSAVQFTQSNLVAQIATILKESELPPQHLELEITEGTVMDSPQSAIKTMLQIRAMGIHLSLDDFGTGYSSLAYLKKFPLNTLKIDKAFVDDIEESEQGRNMVATIITIAHNLGMDVVAEGVETNQQLKFLSDLHCEQLQGYLYSKPLATDHFQKYLIAHQITSKSTSFSQ
ncbi:EAL domain-containing protein [Colwellia sp. 4_MG-2023]|uniref:EAL domain-containing protein n=1 Tax=unclassified Colwellia TaxID=196834 RepID=UPI0026E23040|nr:MULTISPECIES: EAL domain-containing protein [unclassified Colwellia]MDO6507573.1 EAL domain-containing protein [Colwellia sp. 5_MG-2023]MDO6556408.1 EAL domain-containing protein [Colwellia sp. 4_MG-2023]